jgi:hypothetical protein
MNAPVKPQLFKKGEPRPENAGRKPGSANRFTRIIKEAILIAAELEGSNGQGAGKLVGYMRKIAREDVRAMAMLIARAMPLQTEVKQQDMRVEVTYRTVHEVTLELERRGISTALVERALRQPPQVIDMETEEDDDAEDADEDEAEPERDGAGK